MNETTRPTLEDALGALLKQVGTADTPAYIQRIGDDYLLLVGDREQQVTQGTDEVIVSMWDGASDQVVDAPKSPTQDLDTWEW
jgi:hypothetical protein